MRRERVVGRGRGRREKEREGWALEEEGGRRRGGEGRRGCVRREKGRGEGKLKAPK